MGEKWLPIEGFEIYQISNRGRVYNSETERMMALSRTRQGVVKVGLYLHPRQYTKGVTRLVAEAFLPRHENPLFNTAMHVDGDRSNNNVDNLIWRPRWFVKDYVLQFKREPFAFGPIEEIDTLEYFDSTWEAAIKFGLIERDIVRSLEKHLPVWPTKQTFRFCPKVSIHKYS